MDAEQEKQEDHKGSFCSRSVALYVPEDHIQQRSHHSQEEEEEDLEMIMEENHEASSSSSLDDSVQSASSSLDMVDDDASSSSMSSQSNGALDDLSELMSHLPIKRGLSKFYQGKTQSFTSLARVTSLEDLAKKAGGCGGYGRRMKACNSYGSSLNYNSTSHHQRSPYTASPKATISKKSSSSCLRGKMSNHRASFIAIHSSKSPLSCVEI